MSADTGTGENKQRGQGAYIENRWPYFCVRLGEGSIVCIYLEHTV